MNDNEIIKALENIIKENEFEYYHSNTMCWIDEIKCALALINRQKAEIEDLQIIVGLMNKRKYYRKFVDEVFRKQKGKELSDPDFDYIYQLFFEQKAEIERLEMDNAQLQSNIINANMNCDHLLAEVEK